ncbi:hypothetical protein [Sphaerotilus sulfidivorans]|uniref:hypothetical protein n=1 Tax=Sphaerotilus sulfidivorans TaxID=639200 RepID=UPI0011F353E9|nr:hypothetical protein [Sphaerotilus sulfidivorans]GKQ56339.1 hypothetical protein QMTAC487_01970 [Sphaerotilus sp. FB-3]
MKTVFSTLFSLLGIGLMSGCSTVEVRNSVEQPAPVVSSCATCKPAPYYATAVTRPGACNDYPVTYRVQIPEVDDRIRPVDRSQLVSTGGYYAACGSSPCCK